MGTWGPGVFDNDLALDLRASVEARLARGTKVKDLVAEILRRPSILDDPDDGVPVLLALAEILHDLGRPDERITTRAETFAARGDEKRWAEESVALGKARRKELARIRAKLAQPPPRPKKLVVTKTKQTLLRPGDVIALRARANKMLLFVVEGVSSSPSGTAPELVLLDWCGPKVPPPEIVERLPFHFAWRRYDHLGNARVPARFLVGDMLTRVGREQGYEVVGKVDPARWPATTTGGGTVTDCARLGGNALGDLAPQGFPHAPCFDPAATVGSPSEEVRRELRFGVALGAVLRHLNDEPLDTLPARPSAAVVREARRVLRDSWDVSRRDQALLTLWELLQYGHSFEAFRMLTPQGAREAKASEDEEMLRRLRFARAHAKDVKKKLLLAWDLGRASNVATWSFLAGFISDAELRGFLVPAARRARGTYASWRELGEHYCLGREYRLDDADDEREACATLLADKASPWRALRFRP